MRRIINIVILYANEDEVFAYAKNLSMQTAIDHIALVIVVNKRGDVKLEDFSREINSLQIKTFVFDPNENYGYLNGAIYGYNQYCKISDEMPEWVVVSNTDIKYSNNKFFEEFLNSTYSPDVWCVAPSVYSPRKRSYDNPEYIERFSVDKINQLIYIHERPVLASLYGEIAKIKGKFTRKVKLSSQYIYSAKGCFFIIKNEMFTAFSDRPFKALMYSEESYIAEIVRANKKRIYYDSMIEVIHNESATTGKLALEKKSKYIADSLKTIRDEFYSMD